MRIERTSTARLQQSLANRNLMWRYQRFYLAANLCLAARCGAFCRCRRRDQELELQMKARQAQAYEAMKGQFEGLLGRLQVNSSPSCRIVEAAGLSLPGRREYVMSVRGSASKYCLLLPHYFP